MSHTGPTPPGSNPQEPWNAPPPPPEGGYPAAPAPDGYQGMPGMAPQAPAGPVTQPPSIAMAVKLMWAGALLSLISLIITVATKGQLHDQIQKQLNKQGKSLSPSDVDTAVNVGIAVGVVLGAIGIALWLFMAWANGKGKSWARIVATVLAALYIVSFLVNAASGQMTGASMVLSILTLLVAIGTLVMLWRKDSSEFYRAQSAPRYS